MSRKFPVGGQIWGIEIENHRGILTVRSHILTRDVADNILFKRQFSFWVIHSSDVSNVAEVSEKHEIYIRNIDIHIV
jgi:hypothetical protein